MQWLCSRVSSATRLRLNIVVMLACVESKRLRLHIVDFSIVERNDAMIVVADAFVCVWSFVPFNDCCFRCAVVVLARVESNEIETVVVLARVESNEIESEHCSYARVCRQQRHWLYIVGFFVVLIIVIFALYLTCHVSRNFAIAFLCLYSKLKQHTAIQPAPLVLWWMRTRACSRRMCVLCSKLW